MKKSKISNKSFGAFVREKRLDLYEKTIKFINTRVELDFASFKDDVWSH